MIDVKQCLAACEEKMAQGFLPKTEKDLESPSSTCLEPRFPYHDSRAMTRSPSHAHRNLTSLAPQERLPELPIIPREQHHTGAAAREYPRDAPVLTR